MLTWTLDLGTAPKDPPETQVLMAILPGTRHPEAVHWVFYGEDFKGEVDEPGYWSYDEDLINDVTGGVSPNHIEGALWAILDLPKTNNEQVAER